MKRDKIKRYKKRKNHKEKENWSGCWVRLGRLIDCLEDDHMWLLKRQLGGLVAQARHKVTKVHGRDHNFFIGVNHTPIICF